VRNPLFVVVGLALLTFAADRFVLGAARLSSALRISPVIIGAIIIGFGTSSPELLVTSLATLQGSQDLAFGNVVGSNTANVLLVIGAAAVIRTVRVTVPTLRRELPIMLGAVLLLTALTADRLVTTLDALLLLVAAVAGVGFIVWSALRDREAAAALEAEVAEYEGDSSLPVAGALALGG
jgi:cation:H+ antiporter